MQTKKLLPFCSLYFFENTSRKQSKVNAIIPLKYQIKKTDFLNAKMNQSTRMKFLMTSISKFTSLYIINKLVKILTTHLISVHQLLKNTSKWIIFLAKVKISRDLFFWIFVRINCHQFIVFLAKRVYFNKLYFDGP